MSSDPCLKKRLRAAKKIVKQGLKNPFYNLVAKKTRVGVKTMLVDSNGNKSISLSMKPGYYTIYRQLNKELQCLYVGKSNHSIHGRVNRWAKGVAGNLRPDENHPAATKARRDGVKLTDKLMVKFVLMDEVHKIVNDVDIWNEPLDEWIAPLLKSKYNENVFELGASLEDFF